MAFRDIRTSYTSSKNSNFIRPEHHLHQLEEQTHSATNSHLPQYPSHEESPAISGDTIGKSATHTSWEEQAQAKSTQLEEQIA